MTIDEVSAELKINKSTLRYWESIELVPKVARDKNGYREYQEIDLNWAFFIQALRKSGMSISQLKAFVQTYNDRENGDVRKQMLVDQRNNLLTQQNELQKTINYLNYKIDNFGTHMLNYENEKLIYNQEKKANFQ
ncbi:MerR family transcriptional regulator [Fructilactobacillus vespulae]|uniref:MerR family transcriptional regulator n=1 Tax=Fructilactobacillus vespulae TaxID=1249630 RepID=UPI0039B36C33